MTKRVYVAGASSMWWVAKEAISKLREDLGPRAVTYAWPEDVERYMGRQLTKPQQQRIAQQCVAGVRSAQVLLLCLPPLHVSTRGLWLEAGVALAGNKYVVAGGVAAADNVFMRLFDKHFVALDDALDHVIKYVKKRR